MIWLEARSGTLSVKSLYSIMKPRRSVPFLVGVVWNGWVPPKASLFAWEAS